MFAVFFIVMMVFSYSPNPEFGFQEIIYHSNFLSYLNKEGKIIEDQLITITNIKVDSTGRIFTTVPRKNQNSAPLTLAYFDANFTLIAYPDIKENMCKSDHCLFNVNSIEIDGQDRMWVVDSGKYGDSNDTAKILVYDLTTDELLSIHYLDESYYDTKNSFFSDISVDSDNSIAYIVDSGSPFVEEDDDVDDFNSAVVAFDLDTEQVKRVLSVYPFNSPNKISLPTFLTGISIHCDQDQMLFTRNDLEEIHKIETKVILMYNDKEFINTSVTQGTKLRGSYPGISFDSKQRCFLTDIEKHSILYSSQSDMKDKTEWKTITPFSCEKNMSYPYKFGFYDGWLYVISNNLYNYINEEVDPKNMYNFAIWRIFINADSYVDGCSFVGYRISVPEFSLMGAFFGSVVVFAILTIISEHLLQCFLTWRAKKKLEV